MPDSERLFTLISHFKYYLITSNSAIVMSGFKMLTNFITKTCVSGNLELLTQI